jgi:hypothetical protein
VDVPVRRLLEDREVQDQALRSGLPLGGDRGSEQRDEREQCETAHRRILY